MRFEARLEASANGTLVVIAQSPAAAIAASFGVLHLDAKNTHSFKCMSQSPCLVGDGMSSQVPALHLSASSLIQKINLSLVD